MGVYDHYGEQSAAIAQTAAGTTQVVAAVASKRIRVTGFVIVMNAAGTAKFQSASTDKTGAMSFAANGGASSDIPILCATNEALNIVTATSFANGYVSYQLVPG